MAAILKTMLHNSLNMAATSQLICPMPPNQCSTRTWVRCKLTKRLPWLRGHHKRSPLSQEQWREHPLMHQCKIKRSTMWAETRNRKPVWFLSLKRILKSLSSRSVQTMLTKPEISDKRPRKLLMKTKCRQLCLSSRHRTNEWSQIWDVKTSLALRWKNVAAS